MWGTNWMWPCKTGSLHSTSADVNNNLLLKIVQAWRVWKKKKYFSFTRLILICRLYQFSRIRNFLLCPPIPFMQTYGNTLSRVITSLIASLAGQHIWFLLEQESGWLPSVDGLWTRTCFHRVTQCLNCSTAPSKTAVHKEGGSFWSTPSLSHKWFRGLNVIRLTW